MDENLFEYICFLYDFVYFRIISDFLTIIFLRLSQHFFFILGGYIIVSSGGKTCHYLDQEECKQEAIRRGTKLDYVVTGDSLAPGCLMEGNLFWFNTDLNSNVACSTTYRCICKQGISGKGWIGVRKVYAKRQTDVLGEGGKSTDA